MNKQENSIPKYPCHLFKILCILMCLPIFSIAKANHADSIPEDRAHLLEILNDTTENGTLDKRKLNDGGSRVLSQGMQKSDRGIRSLSPSDSTFMIRCPCKSCSKKTPLTLIDGVKVKSGELNKLRPEDIDSFSILKDAKAIEPYGEEGKNGVIIITTKPVE